MSEPPARLLAIGDSITHGEGEPMLGIPCRSWAAWLADSAGLGLVNLARDGATVQAMRTEQVPQIRGRFPLAAVYAGVNDVRSLAFDLERFRIDIDALFGAVAAHAERIVTCTIPLDLGRPRAGEQKVLGANAVISETAARHGAAVAELGDLAGSTLVMPDAVHLWAKGQLEVADRAAQALGADHRPSDLMHAGPSPRALARFAVSNAGPARLRDWRRRAVEAVQRQRNG